MAPTSDHFQRLDRGAAFGRLSTKEAPFRVTAFAVVIKFPVSRGATAFITAPSRTFQSVHENQIEDRCHGALQVSDLNGKVLEDGNKPAASLHGGYGNVLPKIEEALEGQSAGDQVKLDLQPQDAFGARDENLVQTV